MSRRPTKVAQSAACRPWRRCANPKVRARQLRPNVGNLQVGNLARPETATTGQAENNEVKPGDLERTALALRSANTAANSRRVRIFVGSAAGAR